MWRVDAAMAAMAAWLCCVAEEGALGAVHTQKSHFLTGGTKAGHQ